MSDQGDPSQYPFLQSLLGAQQGAGVPTQLFLNALLQIARALREQTQVLSPSALLKLLAIATPATPPAGQFYIYMDAADNKLKAIGPSGTITDIANP